MLRSRCGRTAARSLFRRPWHRRSLSGLSEGEVDVLSREEYNAKKAEYERKLREFRLKVKGEQEMEKQGEEKRRAESAAEWSRKEDVDCEEVKRLKEARAQKHAERILAAKQRKEESFTRESIRRSMVKKMEDERYAGLLEQSRTWITKETLDERIARALDNASTLY